MKKAIIFTLLVVAAIAYFLKRNYDESHKYNTVLAQAPASASVNQASPSNEMALSFIKTVTKGEQVKHYIAVSAFDKSVPLNWVELETRGIEYAGMKRMSGEGKAVIIEFSDSKTNVVLAQFVKLANGKHYLTKYPYGEPQASN